MDSAGLTRYWSMLVFQTSVQFLSSANAKCGHIYGSLSFFKLLDNCRARGMDVKAKLRFEILQVMEHILVNGNLPKTRKVNNNRGDIPTIVKDFYSNKKDLFLQDLSKYIGKDAGNFCLTKDIQLFLNTVKLNPKEKLSSNAYNSATGRPFLFRQSKLCSYQKLLLARNFAMS